MSTFRTLDSKLSVRTLDAGRTALSTRVVTFLMPVLVGVLPACTLAVPETLDGDGGGAPDVVEASDVASSEVTLVALTPISRDRSPMLSHLSERFSVIDVEAAAERLAAAKGPADLEAAFPRGTTLVADVAALDERALDAIRPLADAAADVGVPLVLENVDAPERMASLVGLGFKTEGAIVEPSDRAQSFSITLLGDADTNVETSSDHGQLERLQGARADVAAGPREDSGSKEDDPAAGLSIEGIDATPEELAEQVGDKLVERVMNPPMQVKSINPSEYPIGTFKSYLVKRASVLTWKPKDSYSQTATMDVQFKVDLLASNGAEQGKFVVVSNMGSGFNTGPLMWNHSEDRGYFQDSLSIGVTHGSPHLTSYSHQPHTTNGSNTYTVSNGCSFGGGMEADGPMASFSCSTSSQSSQPISDFSVIDQSAGATTQWNFRMSYGLSTGAIMGGPYNSWGDLVDPWTGYLRALPGLATSNFVPGFEAIYRAGLDFKGQVPFTLTAKQTMRNTWVDWYVFFSEAHTWASTMTQTLSMTADFSRVGTDEAWVTLTAKHSNKCLDIEMGSTDDYARLIQFPCTEQPNQLFEFVKAVDDPGYVYIKPRHSVAQNKCLDVAWGSLADGAQIIQYGCKADADNQKFKLIESGGNYYYFQVKHSGKCITVPGASTGGVPIVQQTCASSDNQRFR